MSRLISLRQAKFPVFKQPISLEILSSQHWAILGSKRGEFLKALSGDYVAEPPTSRSYPSFGKDYWPSQVIQRVDFSSSAQSTAPYVGARFESHRDEFDYSLLQVLQQHSKDEKLIDEIILKLRLNGLEDRWIVGLSNGQSRRVQLALALLKKPKILMVEDPFLGVDPTNRKLLDSILGSLATPVILGLCASQPIPDWIDNVVVAEESEVQIAKPSEIDLATISAGPSRRTGTTLGAPVLKVNKLTASIKSDPIFKDLDFVLREGERVHLKGPNGSGKSTLVAVLTADHPLGWSEQVEMFGEPREVGKHTYFGINSEIGISSPEIHAIFPRNMSGWNAIASGFANNFIAPKNLSSDKKEIVDQWVRRLGVDPEKKFGEMNKTEQKMVLLGRALVKDPRILLLDEAFSTFDDRALKKAFDILDEYRGSVIVIGHVAKEIPPCDSELDMTDWSVEK